MWLALSAITIIGRQSANVHYHMALTKEESGNVEGALESARESVSISTMLGITDKTSQDAADLLRGLEVGR
jgi:hypothetical protein